MICLEASILVFSKYTETAMHNPYLQTINLIVFNIRKLGHDRIYFTKTILFKTALQRPYHMHTKAQHVRKYPCFG